MDYALNEYQDSLEQILLFDNETEPSFQYDFVAYLVSEKARLRQVMRRAMERQAELDKQYGGEND